MKLTKQQKSLLQKLFGKGGYKFVWNHGGHSLYVKVLNENKYAWERGHKYYVMMAYDGETYLKTIMNAGYWEMKKALCESFGFTIAKEVEV